ncbi:uncharacterized protein FA14DRAFT_152108 [Meira miltonrushii]|uniref:Uncharacterized protein n=1 Tax=Meira miltonrushii TaxID=1280837 RepID=A0A316VKU2_9BASI|nr:uncharacterized protein FA14DRAFT_152108 [Meira miltonrushii]PWN36681.1 hypothetical protein FA14DRAFT_152108 [Meira miltonrushii]
MRFDLSAVIALLISNLWFFARICRSQTSPNRNRRVSPDPKDVDWSTLPDLFPIDDELPGSSPAHSSKATIPEMSHDRSPAPSTVFVSDRKKLKAERERRNSQRRKIESPDAYQAMLKRKREQMKLYKSRMTPKQLQIHRAKHVKNQRAHEAKMLAATGFRSIYHADLEKLRQNEAQGTITPEDEKKLAIIRKKNVIRNEKYFPRKRARPNKKKDGEQSG